MNLKSAFLLIFMADGSILSAYTTRKHQFLGPQFFILFFNLWMQTAIQRSLGGVNRKSEIYFHHFPAHLDYGVEEMDF
jgi:hypothetical protein